MSITVGVLTLNIVAAHSLPHSPHHYRRHRLVNPFTVISYGHQSFKTKAVRATTCPEWNEKVHLIVKEDEMKRNLIVFSVYDYDRLGYNACLAITNVRVGYFCEKPDEPIKLALVLNVNDSDRNEESFLFLKGTFHSLRKLKRDFWKFLFKDDGNIVLREHVEYILSKLGIRLDPQLLQNCMEFDTFLSTLNQAHLVAARNCVICSKRPEDDIVGHLAICVHKENISDRLVIGGFVTEEYASRKWYMRVLALLGYGRYRVGFNTANILVKERESGRVIEERIPTFIKLSLRILHANKRYVDWPMIRYIFQTLTVRQGIKYSDPSSVSHIPEFIKYHRLSVDEILMPLDKFANFNDFFYRRLKPEARPLHSPSDPSVVISPADCRIHVFDHVNRATEMWIKGSNFTIENLLKCPFEDAKSIVICRLAPQDYHRFHSPVDGQIVHLQHHPGTYFTVNPIAVRQNIDIFTENARTVMLIDSPQFGRMAFVAVGAMMVGSIVTLKTVGDRVSRMDELGYFAFGGSTVVLIFTANISIDLDLISNSLQPIETLIRVGDRIGALMNS